MTGARDVLAEDGEEDDGAVYGGTDREPGAVADGTAGDGTVLVVDDESAFADAVAIWLEPDYDVELAYDGGAAIEAYDDDVDVVLLDRRMPTVSGDEVLEHVREDAAAAAVAMLTASQLDVADATLDFDLYLRKPVSQKDVHEAVETLERRSAYEEALREYLSTLERLSELREAHATSRLEEHDAYAELESRLSALRPDARDALSGLPDEVAATVRERVAGATYPASLP